MQERVPGLLDRAGSGGITDSEADEVWVIKRYKGKPDSKDESPGTGALLARKREKDKEVPLPLKHTEVKASVRSYIASVNVVQKFKNPFSSKIEAVYVFPLPESAAVNEFIMMIGERRVRGIIRDREEAEKIYEQARAQGYTASLLTQERPNIFTQKVANIEANREIDISITYYHTVPFVDGWYEFTFPMVVGPRFNPPAFSKGVGAVARGAAGRSGQRTEVSYPRPGERSGHDIALQLDIDPGVKIEEHNCKTHAVDVKQSPAENQSMLVQIKRTERIPNKDFVFRYRVAGEQIKSTFLTHEDRNGKYFAFTIIPPYLQEHAARRPVELVFVVDCSGSMSGRPLEQAKAAVERGLKQLEPGDTFQLINFSNNAEALADEPLKATEGNIQRALRHLRNLPSEGGTMMITGIKAALDFPHDPKRLRYVCFLTDGYIGNEQEILQAIQARLGRSRIFSFGIGTSVNRYLMDSMAKAGQGVVAYIGADENPGEIMDLLLARISHPVLTDVEIDWDELQVQDVYPKRIPDLYAGRSIVVSGQYQGALPGSIQVKGSLQDSQATIKLPITSNPDSNFTALPVIWARQKIAELSINRTAGSGSQASIKKLALDYGLISDYTAFMALDASTRTEGGLPITVPAAVPIPESVKYEKAISR